MLRKQTGLGGRPGTSPAPAPLLLLLLTHMTRMRPRKRRVTPVPRATPLENPFKMRSVFSARGTGQTSVSEPLTSTRVVPPTHPAPRRPAPTPGLLPAIPFSSLLQTLMHPTPRLCIFRSDLPATGAGGARPSFGSHHRAPPLPHSGPAPMGHPAGP